MTNPANGPFHEAWADVKAPGDGRQYAVGTITVSDTSPGAMFSNWPASPSGTGGFTLSAPAQRQVVMLQVSDPALPPPGIVWQRYFYGGPSLPLARPTNARAISVWPGATAAETRVAICGEAYDIVIPQAQIPVVPAGGNPNGFIAVYDGDGNLRWTHVVYGLTSGFSCPVTDLSIRVEGTGPDQRDVVTYCGISTHPAMNGELTPIKPFASFNGSSNGATTQATGGWDGFVGRVSVGPLTHDVVFHSTVSGPGQDGFFGLAEIHVNVDPNTPANTIDRFVVVGGTELLGTTTPAAGFAFPGLAGVPGAHNLGVAMVFDAQPTRTGGNLILENVAFFGDPGTGSPTHTHTLARDVVVRHDWFFASPASQLLMVVGSSDSPTALANYHPVGGVSSTFHGGTEGFVALLWDYYSVPATPLLLPGAGRFVGDAGDNGLVGIHGWNEYDDHVVVAGFSQQTPGLPATDILIESYFVDQSAGTFGGLKQIVSTTIASLGDERPAVMGAINATNGATPYTTGPLGDAAGGGIAVDERARAHVVGSTDRDQFPTAGANARTADGGIDAVRVAVDMLQPGVGRTDGTGFQGAFVLPTGAGYTGGTSPACALSRFGRLIGQPVPTVRRVLIDYLGTPPAAGVTGASILVSRPTTALGNPGFVLAGFQYGFPFVGSTIPPLPLSGLESYLTNNPYVYLAGIGYPNQSYIEPLAPLPSPPTLGMPMTVQMSFYVPTLVPGGIGPVGTQCNTVSDFTATPALWMNL